MAGPVAFVGTRTAIGSSDAVPGPHKVLVVVDARAAPTVTIAARSRTYAALGYHRIRHTGTGVRSPRAPRACASKRVAVRPREPWNRGTQFPGYFLVAGARCVHVDVATQGKVLRRKLSFGARC